MRTMVTIAVGVVLMLEGAVFGAEGKMIRSISVSGAAETKTAPDQIVWRIDLTDTDKNLLQAKMKSDEKVKAVVALQKKLGIGEGDLETGSVSVQREYEHDEHGERGDFKHFLVNRCVTIRQRDLKRLDELLDALVSSAEMEINFSFESSRLHEIRAETRLAALQAAKKKAAAMAEAVGAKLGRVLTIDEHPRDGGWQTPMGNAMLVQNAPAADLATEKFVPGAISVFVAVYATFELE